MAKINFAVIGNPIEHSLSPYIHRYFAEQHHLDNFSYEKILSTENTLEEDINNFFSNGGVGLNITIPFKISAYALCDRLDITAKQCGNVNTLKKEGDEIVGYNTDGLGFIDDIKIKNINILNSNILVIGAGGSARSICNSLINIDQEINISILNRTINNAEKLISFFEDSKIGIHRHENNYDLVINTTPISMTDEKIYLPKEILDGDPVCYDLFYSKNTTSFQKWARGHGIKQCFDGLGMLIQQARHSFFIWNGLSSKINDLEKKLRIA